MLLEVAREQVDEGQLVDADYDYGLLGGWLADEEIRVKGEMRRTQLGSSTEQFPRVRWLSKQLLEAESTFDVGRFEFDDYD